MSQYALESKKVAITTAGGAGAATGTGNLGHIRGKIKGIAYAYHASAPATTDVIVRTKGTTKGGVQFQIGARTSGNTGVYHAPRVQAADTAGAPVAGAYDAIEVDDEVEVTVDQADALTDAVIVSIVYEPAADRKV